MKYWRGYLVAAIFAAITLGLRELAATHTKLVDMIYPYVTRMVQNFMAGWSSGVDFCVWQSILLAMAVVGFATVVLMVIFRWNPIQWFGWIVAAVSLVMLLHTGVYGMNEFAGSIAEDIRLEQAAGTQGQMQAAAVYFQEKANALSDQVSREGDSVKVPTLQQLNEQAVDGFDNLVYKQYYSVFAGTKIPVKALGFAQYFTERGQMGHTAAITGEAAVNMEAPGVMIPFAVCREICYRMSIASQTDKHFGAFMACQANEDPLFQYAAYVMAYRYCLNALPETAAKTVAATANTQVRKDVQAWDDFVTVDADVQKIDPDEWIYKLLKKENTKKTQDQIDQEIAQLLVSWHRQKIVLPSLEEPEVKFDPYDETMVDLTGLPHVS